METALLYMIRKVDNRIDSSGVLFVMALYMLARMRNITFHSKRAMHICSPGKRVKVLHIVFTWEPVEVFSALLVGG